MQQAGCTHSDEERCIVGTWVIDEGCKAVEMGYSLVEVSEFWEYAVTRYVKDDATSGGLFAQQVNMFLKLKRNHLVSHPGCKVRMTKIDTLRTTGAQRDFL
jgi:hypothetical protein